jgi:hypothetical protein
MQHFGLHFTFSPVSRQKLTNDKEQLEPMVEAIERQSG